MEQQYFIFVSWFECSIDLLKVEKTFRSCDFKLEIYIIYQKLNQICFGWWGSGGGVMYNMHMG